MSTGARSRSHTSYRSSASSLILKAPVSLWCVLPCVSRAQPNTFKVFYGCSQCCSHIVIYGQHVSDVACSHLGVLQRQGCLTPVVSKVWNQKIPGSILRSQVAICRTIMTPEKTFSLCAGLVATIVYDYASSKPWSTKFLPLCVGASPYHSARVGKRGETHTTRLWRA